MNKNSVLTRYTILLFILILLIVSNGMFYLVSQKHLTEINSIIYKNQELKFLYQKLEKQEFISLTEKLNQPIKLTQELYIINETQRLETNYLLENKTIDLKFRTQLKQQLAERSTVLDSIVNNLSVAENNKALYNFKKILSENNTQSDRIIEELNNNLNNDLIKFRIQKNIILISILILILIIICYFLYVIINKYFVPLSKMSASINKIIKNDFNFGEKFEISEYDNKVGNLSKDIRKMLDKINIKNLEISEEKLKTEETLKNFKILSNIGRTIITQLDVKNIVKVVYDNINQLIPITTFGIGIYKRSENILELWKLDSFSKKIQYNFEKIDSSNDLSVVTFLQSKEILINDYLKEYQNHTSDVGLTLSLNKSMIFVPLKIANQTIGVIYTKYKQSNIYKEYHLDILRNLAIYIAIAIENAKSFEKISFHQREILEQNEEMNQQREEILLINENLENQKIKLEEAFADIKLLSKIGQEITSSLNFDNITENIYKNIDKFMDVTVFGIGIYNKNENRIEFSKLIEENIYLPFNFDSLDEETLSVNCFKHNKELIINDIQVEYSKFLPNQPVPKLGTAPSSIIYIPLTNKGFKLGVITVQSNKKFAYNEQDINIIRTLAVYISIALANAASFEEIDLQRNKIKESEQQMSDIINFIPDPLMVINLEGNLLAWNKSMEELTGVKATEIVGKSDFEYSLAFYGERRPMLCDLILKPSSILEDKYSAVTKQDDKLVGQAFVPKLNKYLWGAARILYNSKNEIVGAIQISKDITEQINSLAEIENANKLLNSQKEEIEKQNAQIVNKSVELHELVEELQTTSAVVEEYNKELEKLSIVASKTDNAVIIANFDGKIEWVNEGFQRLFGYDLISYIQAKGSTIYEVSSNPDITNIIQESIDNRKSAVYSSKNITASGDEIWVQTTLTPIFNEGKLDKIIAIDTNISKIKLAENEIENQNKKITYSIQYARRIQSAILTPKRFIDRTLADYFILYKPRDIVSGDFYWVARKHTKIIIAVSDCTGHGVPGAFMSILGISFLNEILTKIVEKNGIIDIKSSTILNQLKVNIIKSLHQKGKQLETKDGMDIAICIFDIDTRIVQYAGANLPLLLVRKIIDNEKIELNEEYCKKQEYPEKEIDIYEFKPDKYPIGISKNAIDNFIDKEFKVKIGDIIYLHTDGYIDQFGGLLGRKFLSKNFKNLLSEIYEKTMPEQEQILDETIENWKSYPRETGKGWNQIDDILVMAIKF